MLVELPPEEAFESFAARLRPFTIRDERVYWELVLNAIEDLTPQKIRDEVIDLEGLRAAYAGVTQGKNTPQAYSVITENGQLTDLQIADLWLYSDALHARTITSAVGTDLGLDERYRAAAGVYARLGSVVNATYNLIAHLVREGLLDLDKAVFTERVIAETRIDMPMVAVSAHRSVPPDAFGYVGYVGIGPQLAADRGSVRGDHRGQEERRRGKPLPPVAGVRAGTGLGAEPPSHGVSAGQFGADDGNRTRVFSLEAARPSSGQCERPPATKPSSTPWFVRIYVP